jgi:hypothetical protein
VGGFEIGSFWASAIVRYSTERLGEP